MTDAPPAGRELEKAIIALARSLGWKVAHTPRLQDVRGNWRTPIAADGKGFPDLLLVRDRLIVVECKSGAGKLSAEQESWLTAFRLAGIAAHVWTPAEWTSGEIERILRSRGQQPYRRTDSLPGVTVVPA